MADTNKDPRLSSQGIRTPSVRPEVVAVPGGLRSLSSDGLFTVCPARAVEESVIAKNPEGEVSSHGFQMPGSASTRKADGSRTREGGSRSRSRGGGVKSRSGSRSREASVENPLPGKGRVAVVSVEKLDGERMILRQKRSVSPGSNAVAGSLGPTERMDVPEDVGAGEKAGAEAMESVSLLPSMEGNKEEGAHFDPATCLPPQAYEDESEISVSGARSVRESSMSVVEVFDEEVETVVQERRGSIASTESKRGRGRPPEPNYEKDKVKAIREKRVKAPTALSRNLAGPSDADLVSYQDKLTQKSVIYDPNKDSSDVTQLGLLAHQKALVTEETRAYKAMSAEELTINRPW